MLYRVFAAVLFCVSLLPAERDFLTADEVDQVRLAQEPNERLKLYLSFARQRIAQIQQAVAKDKPGRSKFVHDLLEDYTKIVEAMDTVSDDALRRKVNIAEGTKLIADTNRQFLTELEKIRDSEPKDLARYGFALDQAIDATRDSSELAAEDLSKRSTELQTRAAKEKKERDETLRPEDVAEKKDTARKETETKRKAPTLRRKGEVVKEQ